MKRAFVVVFALSCHIAHAESVSSHDIEVFCQGRSSRLAESERASEVASCTSLVSAAITALVDKPKPAAAPKRSKKSSGGDMGLVTPTF